MCVLELLMTRASHHPVSFHRLIIHICVCACVFSSVVSLMSVQFSGGVHVYPAWSLSCHRGSHASGQPADALRRPRCLFQTQPAQCITRQSGDKRNTSKRFSHLRGWDKKENLEYLIRKVNLECLMDCFIKCVELVVKT